VTGRIEIRVSSFRRERALARLVRIVALAPFCVLALVGVHSALAGRSTEVVKRASGGRSDLQAQAFAESFARAYLSWDAAHPERREAALRRYFSDAVDPAAGVSTPARGGREVTWTTVTGDASIGADGHVVTVAAGTDRATQYLAVPVHRDDRGFLYVASYPALVGGPVAAVHAELANEPELGDGSLRGVVARALSNYLAREVRNLRADLDPAAVVSLPPQELRLDSVEAMSRARPGWVAAQVVVTDPQGVELTLRYEVEVVQRDRWYVRSIGPNPTGRTPS